MKPLKLYGIIFSDAVSAGMLLGTGGAWVRSGEIYGGGRDADFVDEIFPLEMT